ncbi:hypothetical protein Pfra02_36590 [Pseudomonas fragi]|nr:hypothetical protein Pfra02_36590 [Pseudomonas fragi]
MSPALTIFLLFSGWLAVAAAMLWGVMRISRRHHPQTVPAQKNPADTPKINTANAH